MLMFLLGALPGILAVGGFIAVIGSEMRSNSDDFEFEVYHADPTGGQPSAY